MRLDKFLKTARIIKRRTIAKEIADQGRILVNNRVAKSSTDVHPSDKMIIKFGNKTLTIQVHEVLETTKKADASRMYSVLDESYEHDYSQI
ncbi:RNA-binding S4 domain-containing protein [Apilactobacillus sp. TMW 2.2459]|uniref:RNA-binding S4 domain-containing protein n=1 Tax=Apilactobacillus xinyiensis TaxID=2841032 RepID=UPI00200DB87F|nr:RNA-binding S4 domain-containing protein [Apilactobacillus xinyiensis]MCL0312883.1 RNA-binding S4 domain-containing protein [Apilactobacillus xinyiensis]